MFLIFWYPLCVSVRLLARCSVPASQLFACLASLWPTNPGWPVGSLSQLEISTISSSHQSTWYLWMFIPLSSNKSLLVTEMKIIRKTLYVAKTFQKENIYFSFRIGTKTKWWQRFDHMITFVTKTNWSNWMFMSRRDIRTSTALNIWWCWIALWLILSFLASWSRLSFKVKLDAWLVYWVLSVECWQILSHIDSNYPV